jgi:sarcosine oxidase gamma subunit
MQSDLGRVAAGAAANPADGAGRLLFVIGLRGAQTGHGAPKTANGPDEFAIRRRSAMTVCIAAARAGQFRLGGASTVTSGETAALIHGEKAHGRLNGSTVALQGYFTAPATRLRPEHRPAGRRTATSTVGFVS